MEIILFIAIIVIVTILTAIKIVPQQNVWVVERLGKFHKKLDAGLSIILPFIDKVSYKHTLKEEAIDVPEQSAITNDNVSVRIGGIIYVKIIDPIAASYGVANPYYAITQLAKTTMRSVIGKMALDKTFEGREGINASIVIAINDAATNWGVQCMRYEILDIKTPETVGRAMELQVAAERQKRAEILESEGKRQSQINHAEGYRQELVLKSEAEMIQKINQAKGEAEAILSVATATAKGLEIVGKSISENGGSDAVSLKLAQQYIDAFSELARTNNTVIIPSNVTDASGIIAQATTIFKTISKVKNL